MTQQEKKIFRDLITTGINKDDRGYYYRKSIQGFSVKCYVTKRTIREVSLLK